MSKLISKIFRKFRFLFLFKPFEFFLRNLLNNKNSNKYLSLLVPQHYKYKKNDYRYFNELGIKMKLNLNHYNDHLTYWYFKKDILLNNIVNFINDKDIVFDVGVNIGYYLLNFSKKASNGYVYGFEPNPKVFNYVKYNCELNFSKNIHLSNIGLGNKEGNFKMAQINDNLGMNQIINSEKKQINSFTVKVDILDNFVKKNKIPTINVIKIDVEGFEFNVLKGAEKSIQNFKPILFIEIDEKNLNENNTSFKEIQTWLSHREYVLYDANSINIINNKITVNHFDILAIPSEKLSSYSYLLKQ